MILNLFVLPRELFVEPERNVPVWDFSESECELDAGKQWTIPLLII